MTITEPVYANREQVKRALDIMETARSNEQIDRLLMSCSRSIDGELHRVFYPRLESLSWDWINSSSPTPWRLWLDDKELSSINSLTSGGVVIPNDTLILYPNDGPPYNRVEIDTSTTSSFTLGTTFQNAITIDGELSGCRLVFSSAGGLVFSVSDSVATITIPNGALLGVGDLLKVDNEYLLTVDRNWVDSTQNLQVDLSSSSSDVIVAVTNGASFFNGEVILLDAEKMLVVGIAGNSLLVKRAWDGSVLSEHSNSDVYVTRSLTVLRGQVGSEASSHISSSDISRWVPPPLINQLCVGEVLTAIEQEQSAYARVVGSGDNAFEARGIGLEDIRSRAYTHHGRKSRHRAV